MCNLAARINEIYIRLCVSLSFVVFITMIYYYYGREQVSDFNCFTNDINGDKNYDADVELEEKSVVFSETMQAMSRDKIKVLQCTTTDKQESKYTLGKLRS